MDWRRVIEQTILSLSHEITPLEQSYGRVAAADLFSTFDVPEHPESLRDGYLFFRNDLHFAAKNGLPVVFEVAAGTIAIPELQRGEAHRIFTGGQILTSEKDLCVVPFEMCTKEGDRIFPDAVVCSKLHPSYIAGRGAEIPLGACLVRAGQRLDGEALARLAASGVSELNVFMRPAVSVCCTGSELVVPGSSHQRGKKYSVNRFILGGGLKPYSASLENCQVNDSPQEIAALFLDISSKNLFLTTGGMGPGKYDLVRDAFIAAGGTVLLESLSMRPGHFILFGVLKGVPVLGLPGPPRAVATLLHELVLPVVRLLSGEKSVWPKTIEATLLEDDKKPRPFVRLKPGVLSWEKGACFVREIENLERADCHIVYSAGCSAEKGELVSVHLIAGSEGRRSSHGRQE